MNATRTLPLAVIATLVGLCFATATAPRADQSHDHGPSATAATTAATATPSIPKSIQEEHEAIHGSLVAARKAPGQVGAAARELANVLHPHFVREEQIALPPLGLLAPLASGATVSDAAMALVLPMTDSLRAELPRMLEEHKRIRAAVEKLGAAARAEKSESAQRLAEELAAHARNEEEVLYPAAILVGDVIRARQKAK